MKMFYKADNALVEVYEIYIENNKPMALLFSPSLHGKSGNGWEKVKCSQLIPAEYYDPAANKGFMSKSKRNEIKERLTLTSAIWTCTDNKSFSNCDEAIKHEAEIMEKEISNYAK